MFDHKCIFLPDFEKKPSFPVMKFKKEDFKNGIAVRTPNWLGDLIMTLPAMKQLKAMLPEYCGLSVLTPKPFVPVLKALKDTVDDIQVIENPHAFMNERERSKLSSFTPCACILFNNSLRDVLSIRYSLPFTPVYGAKARGRSIFLTRSFDFGKRKDGQLNPPHQAMRCLAMAEAMGAPQWDGAMPQFYPDCNKERFIKKFGFFPENLLILSPGAAYGGAKRWNPENFKALGNWWIQRGGTIAASGTAKEAAACSDALSGLPQDKVYNLAGKTSMDELIYLLQNATFCIANDSGIMHLAAAVGLPGVATFGSTDMAATAPVSKQWRIVFVKEKCAPCFKRACPYGTTQCLKNVTPNLVIQAAEQLLAELKSC